MSFTRLYYEIRLLGKAVILPPILVILGFTLLIILVQRGISADNIKKALASTLEVLLPMISGMVVATVASHDHAIELQLTMPHRYHHTAFGRFLLIFLWTALLSFLTALLLYILGKQQVPTEISTWHEPWQFLTWQLSWFASNIWLIAVGLLFSLLIRSRSASGALIGVIAVLELVSHNDFNNILWLRPVYLFPLTFSPDASYWLENRAELIGTAIVLLGIGWLLLQQTELLLSHAAGEE